jgi:3-phenylpropionate/trans-cinnamate dioxygenase ferredoxin subunit
VARTPASSFSSWGAPEMARATTERLVDVAELNGRCVTVVKHPDHGDLAVGMSDGQPFAVSNRCRHLLGPLGEGRVVDGLLECPWHRARYEVGSGRMVAGPGGAFRPVGRLVKDTTGRRPLTTYPVELREGAIWLIDPGGKSRAAED